MFSRSCLQKLYEEMKDRIETATKLGRIPQEVRMENEGFSQWDSFSSGHDHDTILEVLCCHNLFKTTYTHAYIYIYIPGLAVMFPKYMSTMNKNMCIQAFNLVLNCCIFFCQIIIDGRDPKAMDVERSKLPTLVYLAREKRPWHPHNFKAGAMNALVHYRHTHTYIYMGKGFNNNVNLW